MCVCLMWVCASVCVWCVCVCVCVYGRVCRVCVCGLISACEWGEYKQCMMWTFAAVCQLGFAAAGEPLSPISDCRSKGLHYTVKYIRDKHTSGVECLLCGLIGNLDNIKKVPCLPSSSPGSVDQVPEPAVVTTGGERAVENAEALADAELQFRKLQEMEDRKAALELAELHRQEAELGAMVLLHKLEAEEAELEGLLLQQRQLALAEKTVAKKLLFSDATPEPRDPPKRAQGCSQLEPEAPQAEPDHEDPPLVSIVPPPMDLPYGARVLQY